MTTRNLTTKTSVETKLHARQSQMGLILTRLMGWMCALIAVVVALIWVSFPQFTQLLGIIGLALLITVSAAAHHFLHSQGREQVGVYLFLGAFVFAVTVGTVLVPEILPVTGLGYTLIILLGIQLVGERNARGLMGACVVIYGVALALVELGSIKWFPPLSVEVSTAFVTSLGVMAFIFVCLVVRSVSVDQERQFRQALLANAELQGLLRQIQETASAVGAASGQILAASVEQAAWASEQSAAIAQTSTTVNEVKTISEQSTLRSQAVASTTQRTVGIARSGQSAVQDTIESMTHIKERVEGIAQNTLVLSEQMQQIGEITATVNDIATQSKLLALNAAVEAAHAGEQGKGFAVVALEVGNLAEQSKQATARVKALLFQIQQATNTTLIATEEGTKRVQEGVRLVAQARQTIEQLADVINESAQAATQMAASGQQQIVGVEQIATAMGSINQATMQSLASTRQTESAAQNLNQLARRLTEAVAQYRE